MIMIVMDSIPIIHCSLVLLHLRAYNQLSAKQFFTFQTLKESFHPCE